MSFESLVNITHESNSLWSKTKDANELDFSSSIANISNISIDFTELIKDDGTVFCFELDTTVVPDLDMPIRPIFEYIYIYITTL